MKLINIALKYCKKTVSILLILLILVVPMMNASKSYAQENTSYKITENISNEKYQIDREMINELLKKISSNRLGEFSRYHENWK